MTIYNKECPDSILKSEEIPNNPPLENWEHLGFMSGELTVPDDFNQMGSKEIKHLFGDLET